MITEILDMRVGDIRDLVTRRLVIKMIERSIEGEGEFGNLMHEVKRTELQYQMDMVEELLDFINYDRMPRCQESMK
jgi:hypothetical protein